MRVFNSQEYVIEITVEGGSDGLKVLVLDRVTCLACPRAFFDAHKSKHDEFSRGGVYVLTREKDGKQTINIGQTGNFAARFHGKTPWKDVESVIVFTGNSKDDQIGGVSENLESSLLVMARERGYVVENANASHPRELSRSETIKYNGYLGAIKALWPHIGLDTPPRNPAAPAAEKKPAKTKSAPPSAPLPLPDIYECTIARTKHKAYLRLVKHRDAPPSFLVTKGSKARKEVTKGIYDSQLRERERLKADGVLRDEGTHLVFAEDHPFTSSTMAASVVMGRSANGFTEWKTRAGKELGKTLEEITDEAD